MFQQIAAQILGITLTRIQVESVQAPIVAPIVKLKEAKAVQPVQQKTSVCLIQ